MELAKLVGVISLRVGFSCSSFQRMTSFQFMGAKKGWALISSASAEEEPRRRLGLRLRSRLRMSRVSGFMSLGSLRVPRLMLLKSCSLDFE